MIIIYQIYTNAWFGKQYNTLVCNNCIVSFTPDALIVTTSNNIPLMYLNTQKWYNTISQSTDYGVYNLYDGSRAN